MVYWVWQRFEKLACYMYLLQMVDNLTQINEENPQRTANKIK